MKPCGELRNREIWLSSRRLNVTRREKRRYFDSLRRTPVERRRSWRASRRSISIFEQTRASESAQRPVRKPQSPEDGSKPIESREEKRTECMINGAHVIVYSKDAEADRAFFKDVLGFPSVDAGHGWLIFALPPAEAAFHPSEKNDLHELYFMCDDLKATMESLKGKEVK